MILKIKKIADLMIAKIRKVTDLMIPKIRKATDLTIPQIGKFTKDYSRVILAVVLCAAVAVAVGVTTGRVNTFRFDDGSTVRKVRILGDSIESAAKSLSLETDNYEILETKKENGFINVKIGYTFPVDIVAGSKTVRVKTAGITVGDALKLAGFKMGVYDTVIPAAETVLKEKTTVVYSKIDFITGSYKQAIPCSLDTVYSTEKLVGENTIVQGTDGQQEVYYTSMVVNGRAVETVVNNVVVLSEAVNGKHIIGTASPKEPAAAVATTEVQNVISTLAPTVPIKLDVNGNPVNYKNKLTVQATGYTYTGHNCSTGVKPQPGYIAVNPKFIPYGTKMYIKTPDGAYIYGYAVAADTGGFIKSRPTNVDLFFKTKSECKAFGRRNVEIFILE